jgi:hypothetical protein
MIGDCGFDLLQRQSPDSSSSLRCVHHFSPAGRTAAAAGLLAVVDERLPRARPWNRGDEAIRSILDVVYAKAPYTVIQQTMHIHPTVWELISIMLAELEAPSGGNGTLQVAPA